MVHDFISLFFPNVCCICYQPLVISEKAVCVECKVSLPKTGHWLEYQNNLKNRFAGKINIHHAMAYYFFNKQGSVQKLLHEIKYRNSPEVGHIIGEWFGAELLQFNFHKEFDLIVAIPLHSSKLKKRGYNQSKNIAKGMSESLGVPMAEEAIKRILNSQTQTKKSRLERWKNVENIFKVKDPLLFKGKNVLLVDDVVTTGATFEACGLEILRSGANSLSICALAMAK